jgi:hypothetical protein
MLNSGLPPTFATPAPTFAKSDGTLLDSNQGAVPLGVGAPTEHLFIPEVIVDNAPKKPIEPSQVMQEDLRLPELPHHIRQAL